jgi:hypothetical protein
MWVEYYHIEKGGLTVFFHLLPGILFVCFGIFAFWTTRKESENRGCTLTFLSLWMLGALLWTIGVGYDITRNYLRLTSALHENRCLETEGVVENFTTTPTRHGEMDSFTINGIQFKYTWQGVHPGFNELQSRGGPLADGRLIKIRYYEGQILVLWLWEDQ